ncbi:MAG: SDR family oxidoreductase [Pseudomonadota bacterium]
MSAFDLTDRVAIVTGGGGTEHGTGRSIALALADAGAAVVLASRDTGHLDPVANTLTERGARSQVIQCDVTDPAQCANLVTAATETFGRLDILVNNAASSHMGDPLELTAEQWREDIDVNLNGTFFCAQAAARHMATQQRGHIVNIASSSGIKGDEFMAPYAASSARAETQPPSPRPSHRCAEPQWSSDPTVA